MSMLSVFILACVIAYGSSATLNDCSVKLEPLGCYVDRRNERTLPEQILNERDRHSNSYNGRLVNWKDYHNYLAGFICRCAVKAFQKGYKVIGIQYFGECWSGPEGHASYDRIGSAESCINGDFQKLQGTQTTCDVATGAMSTNMVYRIAPTDCDTYYEPIGCFNDWQRRPRPLEHYLSSERSPSSPVYNGYLISWKNWNTYSPKLICRCAALAKSKGHKYFALQFWGECWSSERNVTITYDRDGPSTRCLGKDFKPCPCNSYHCVGKANTNHVYKLISPPPSEV